MVPDDRADMGDGWHDVRSAAGTGRLSGLELTRLMSPASALAVLDFRSFLDERLRSLWPSATCCIRGLFAIPCFHSYASAFADLICLIRRKWRRCSGMDFPA